MIITIEFKHRSDPITYTNASQTYEKGSFYCIELADGKTVDKYPIDTIEKIREQAGDIRQVHQAD